MNKTSKKSLKNTPSKYPEYNLIKSTTLFFHKLIFQNYCLAIRSISTDAPTARPVTPIHVLAGSLFSSK